MRIAKAWLVVGVCLGLAACSSGPSTVAPRPSRSTPSRSTAVTSTAQVCAPLSSLDVLRIIRTDAFPQNHLRFGIGAHVLLTDPAGVRQVATVLCALPVQPLGSYHCPVDLGVSYALTFSAAGRPFPVVIANAGGCQAVTGLGQVRQGGDALWQALGHALHVKHADQHTFGGLMPVGAALPAPIG